jgi:GTP-binding protein
VPNLGVARVDDDALVIADVPGLIEGAHRGLGLGTRFLRHLSRTAVLVHLIDLADPRDPLAAFDAVNRELASFDAELAAKPQIVVATKLDVTEARDRFEAARAAFRDRGVDLLGISAVTGLGVAALLARAAAAVRAARDRAGAAGAPAGAPATDATAPATDATARAADTAGAPSAAGDTPIRAPRRARGSAA